MPLASIAGYRLNSGINFLDAMNNAMPHLLDLTCSKARRVTAGFPDFLSERIGEGSFDRDKKK